MFDIIRQISGKTTTGWFGQRLVSGRVSGVSGMSVAGGYVCAGTLGGGAGRKDTPMAERPVLDQVNLVVRDMLKTVAFYRLLGVEIDEPGPPWDAHHRTI